MVKRLAGYREKASRKKQWQKPILTILARDKSGEAILRVCKGMDIGSGPMSEGYMNCLAYNESDVIPRVPPCHTGCANRTVS